MLEGPRPCKSFVLCSQTVHESRNTNVSIACVSTHNHLTYLPGFVQGQPPKIANKTTKIFARFDNNSLYYYGRPTSDVPRRTREDYPERSSSITKVVFYVSRYLIFAPVFILFLLQTAIKSSS